MAISEQPAKPQGFWLRLWNIVMFKSTEIDLRRLLKTAGLFILLGTFFYTAEVVLDDHKWPGVHIAQHLSVAFWVASFSIVGIEINAKRRAREELDRFIREFEKFKGAVSENVFEAVIGRVVPGQIVEEVKELLRSAFIKTECEYTIRFVRRYDDMPDGYCVLRRDLRFKVNNLSAHPATFPIRSSHTVDENIGETVWKGRPFHLELWVDNVQKKPGEFLKDKKGFDLEYFVELNSKDSASIFLLSEEPMRIEANRTFYSQNSSVDALAVSIENECRDLIGEIEVQMHHPGRGEVIHERPDRHTLRRAFFPGQGFEVSWKRISPQTDKDSGELLEEVPRGEEADRTAAEHSQKTVRESPQGNLPL
jgi:hypothetical protein